MPIEASGSRQRQPFSSKVGSEIGILGLQVRIEFVSYSQTYS